MAMRILFLAEVACVYVKQFKNMATSEITNVRMQFTMHEEHHCSPPVPLRLAVKRLQDTPTALSSGAITSTRRLCSTPCVDMATASSAT